VTNNDWHAITVQLSSTVSVQFLGDGLAITLRAHTLCRTKIKQLEISYVPLQK